MLKGPLICNTRIQNAIIRKHRNCVACLVESSGILEHRNRSNGLFGCFMGKSTRFWRQTQRKNSMESSLILDLLKNSYELSRSIVISQEYQGPLPLFQRAIQEIFLQDSIPMRLLEKSFISKHRSKSRFRKLKPTP